MAPECYSLRNLRLFEHQLVIHLFCLYTQRRGPQVSLFQLAPNTGSSDPYHRVLRWAALKPL